MEHGTPLLDVKLDDLQPAESEEAYKGIYRTQRQQITTAYTTCLFLFFFLTYWLFERDRIAAGVVLAIVALLLGYFKWHEIRQLREATGRAQKNLPVRLTFTENGLVGETPYAQSFR